MPHSCQKDPFADAAHAFYPVSIQSASRLPSPDARSTHTSTLLKTDSVEGKLGALRHCSECTLQQARVLAAANTAIEGVRFSAVASAAYLAVHPRSICIVAPVMAPASSVQRNAASPATSWGSISRLTAAGSSITFSITWSSDMFRALA